MGKKLVNEFKEFISRGNVVDLAVGVIIGGKMAADGTLQEVCAGQSLEDRFFAIYAQTVGEEA